MFAWKEVRLSLDSVWVTTVLDWIPHLGSRQGLVIDGVLSSCPSSSSEGRDVGLLVRGAIHGPSRLVVQGSSVPTLTEIDVGAADEVMNGTIRGFLSIVDLAVDVILGENGLSVG